MIKCIPFVGVHVGALVAEVAAAAAAVAQDVSQLVATARVPDSLAAVIKQHY